MWKCQTHIFLHERTKAYDDKDKAAVIRSEIYHYFLNAKSSQVRPILKRFNAPVTGRYVIIDDTTSIDCANYRMLFYYLDIPGIPQPSEEDIRVFCDYIVAQCRLARNPASAPVLTQNLSNASQHNIPLNTSHNNNELNSDCESGDSDFEPIPKYIKKKESKSQQKRPDVKRKEPPDSLAIIPKPKRKYTKKLKTLNADSAQSKKMHNTITKMPSESTSSTALILTG